VSAANAAADFRFPHRVRGLRNALAPEQVEAAIITHLENVRYLTGFSGSNGLVIVTPTEAVFLTDGRYTVQAGREVPGWERVILPQGTDMAEAAGEQIKRLGARRVAFEEAHLTVKAFGALEKAVKGEEGNATGVELVGKSNLVENLRQIKDAHEIAAIREAITLADACFEHICRITRPGVTERDLAWQIETFCAPTARSGSRSRPLSRPGRTPLCRTPARRSAFWASPAARSLWFSTTGRN
jgi:Xaa-Pro aminopeptidase